MFGIGIPELLIILILALIIFGSSRLPEIGSSLGKAIQNFKKASKNQDPSSTEEKENDKNLS